MIVPVFYYKKQAYIKACNIVANKTGTKDYDTFILVLESEIDKSMDKEIEDFLFEFVLNEF